MFTIYVKKVLSKSGKSFFALCVDLGYVIKFLCVGVSDIAEVLGMSVSEFHSRFGKLDFGDCVEVGIITGVAS